MNIKLQPIHFKAPTPTGAKTDLALSDKTAALVKGLKQAVGSKEIRNRPDPERITIVLSSIQNNYTKTKSPEDPPWPELLSLIFEAASRSKSS